MKLEWSVPAFNDLIALRDYIAQDSPVYARRFAEHLLESVESLQDFPARGRHVPEAGRDDIREVMFHPYRIIYQISADRIVVLAVIYGRRDTVGDDRKPWDVG